MKVFVTGATGYIGSAVVEKLLAAGHKVVGLARSDEAARKLAAAGAEALAGDIRDADIIKRGAREADGVIHAVATGTPDGPQADSQAVSAILDALAGTDKPFVYSSGIWVLGNTGERLADEESALDPTPLVAWRPANEKLVLDAAARGVRSIVLRPAIVYGRGGGIIGEMVEQGRQKRVVRFVGTGENHWPLVHVDDLADLYLKALEQAPAGTLLLAASGPALTVREVAEAAARAAGCEGSVESWPIEQARERLGSYADALTLDQQVSGRKAIELLDWQPRAPSLQAELAAESGRRSH
ncbi:MAG TPA: SDR family oxidoreductase [Pyrinomonadaceae bacterium]